MNMIEFVGGPLCGHKEPDTGFDAMRAPRLMQDWLEMDGSLLDDSVETMLYYRRFRVIRGTAVPFYVAEEALPFFRSCESADDG